MTKTIRWGIAGPGKIAQKFAADLALVPDCELAAVGSRNLDRAKDFADEFNGRRAYGSYEELFGSPEVDVIYIASPHTSHMEMSLQAIAHGKHVLCEKPLGINGGEVARTIEAARQKGVFLMEALWSRFNPAVREALELVESGEIGKVNYLHADFAFYALDKDRKGRLLNPELGGGTILDIGIYPIFLAYLILGKPDRIQAASRFFETGVEIQTSMLFEYEDALAVLYSGLNSTSEMRAEISATHGSVFLEPRWHETEVLSLEKEGEVTRFDLPTPGNGYTFEIEEVNACLRRGDLESALWSHQNSLDLVAMMDEVRAIGGVRFPFETDS